MLGIFNPQLLSEIKGYLLNDKSSIVVVLVIFLMLNDWDQELSRNHKDRKLELFGSNFGMKLI